jgi:hypothetical protein
MVSVSRRKRSIGGFSPPEGSSPAESSSAESRPQAAGADDQNLRKRKDKRTLAVDKPGAGRTTRLGRKVESPASIKTAGPSGQRGGTQHQKQHTNK